MISEADMVNQKSLYERLGGEDGITVLVGEIVEAHMQNTHINSYFLPLKDRAKDLAIIKKHTVEFFAAGSGGPQKYTGKDMSSAHKGMNISDKDYQHTLEDIMSVLNKNNIDDQSKEEVLIILHSLKEMIVRA